MKEHIDATTNASVLLATQIVVKIAVCKLIYVSRQSNKHTPLLPILNVVCSLLLLVEADVTVIHFFAQV